MRFKDEIASSQAGSRGRSADVNSRAPQDRALPSPFPDIPQSRVAWVDVSRGLGIILVVYGHALRGNFSLADADSWQAAQDRIIYSFHMPLFFVLAGLFLWKSISKDRCGFVAGRWEQIIYPYLFWSAITAAIELPMASFVNSPISWREILLIPLQPIEQYWFLYALLVHQLIAAIAYPRKWLLLAAVVGGWGLASWLGGGWIVVRSMLYLPYLVAGILAVPLLQALAHASFVARTSVAMGSWLALALMSSSNVTAPISAMQSYAMGLSGSLGLIATAMLLNTRLALTRSLILLGRASLAIYVAHTIFSAGSRIGLKLVGIAPETGISFVTANIVGLLFPLILWRVATVRGWSQWIGFGKASRRIES